VLKSGGGVKQQAYLRKLWFRGGAPAGPRAPETESFPVFELSTVKQNLHSFHRIHRIHRRQHAFTDDTGMSKHRLPPYNAYYHN